MVNSGNNTQWQQWQCCHPASQYQSHAVSPKALQGTTVMRPWLAAVDQQWGVDTTSTDIGRALGKHLSSSFGQGGPRSPALWEEDLGRGLTTKQLPRKLSLKWTR